MNRCKLGLIWSQFIDKGKIFCYINTWPNMAPEWIEEIGGEVKRERERERERERGGTYTNIVIF